MRRRDLENKTTEENTKQSSASVGIAIGAVCVCMGMVIFIPRLGVSGVLFTLLAMVWTISCAIQLFRKSARDDEEEYIPPPMPPMEELIPQEEEEETDPVTIQLMQLQDLYVSKVLTREEYLEAVRAVTENAPPPEDNAQEETEPQKEEEQQR